MTPRLTALRVGRLGLLSGIGAVLLWGVLIVDAAAFDGLLSSGSIRELRAGLLAHDVSGLWSGQSKERGPDVGAEIFFDRALFQVLAATAYPGVGMHLNVSNATSKVYGGFLLQWETKAGLLFSTGLGLALHDGSRSTDSPDHKSLGSQVLFRIPVEIGYALDRRHRILLAFDHVSNANLAQPNEGMDTLGLVYAYRFD